MSYAPSELGTAGRPRNSTSLANIFQNLLDVADRAAKLWTSRREVRHLALLEDHNLADIGLSRADIDWAMAQPWHLDATEGLAKRVDCRRAAKHWAHSVIRS